MIIPILFKQYIWQIETINRVGKMSLAEINELDLPSWRGAETLCCVGTLAHGCCDNKNIK